MPGNLGSLGSLFVDVAANTANFETDIGRAQRLAAKSAREMQRRIGEATAAIGLSFAAVGVGAVAAFAKLNDVANSIANYKDLSERIGDTAQAVASLKPVADVSGVALDTVAGASVKLTAALSKQSEESGGAAAAIKALGLDFKSFQQLAPVAQIEAVAAQFAMFEDNANKTAAAVALFGKSGAELIPFLNDLADRGERQVVLTQQQIEAADEYAKRLDRTKGQVSTLAQRYAADMIPALDTVLNVQKELLKPEYINAAQQLATSLINIAGGLAKITANTVGLAQFLGESLAAAVVGPNDAVRLGDEIDSIGKRIAALKRQQSKSQPGSSMYEADARAIAKQEAALIKLQDRLRVLNQYSAPSATALAAAASGSAPASARPSLAFKALAAPKGAAGDKPKLGPMQDAAIKDVLREIEQRDRMMEAAKRDRERVAESLAAQYGPASVGGVEGENARYAAELEAFDNSRQELIALGADYYALQAEAARAHQDELTRIEQAGNEARRRSTEQSLYVAGQIVANLSSAAESAGLARSKRGFEAAKLLNIAQATISTATAISNALAVPPYPLGLALATSAGIAGAAQIAAIKSQKFGGGRRYGGAVAAGGIYEVAEPGNPELIKYGSKTILAMGSQPGTVIPAKAMSAQAAMAGGRGAGNVSIVVNNTAGDLVGARARSARGLNGDQVIELVVAELDDNAGPISRAMTRKTGMRGRGAIG